METKFYTSIEESKKLLELGLNPNTADMSYRDYQWKTNNDGSLIEGSIKPLETKPWVGNEWDDYPCWSINALMEIIENAVYTLMEINADTEIGNNSWANYDFVSCMYSIYDENKDEYYETNDIVEMVVWLLENNYIKKEK